MHKSQQLLFAFQHSHTLRRRARTFSSGLFFLTEWQTRQLPTLISERPDPLTQTGSETGCLLPRVGLLLKPGDSGLVVYAAFIFPTFQRPGMPRAPPLGETQTPRCVHKSQNAYVLEHSQPQEFQQCGLHKKRLPCLNGSDWGPHREGLGVEKRITVEINIPPLSASLIPSSSFLSSTSSATVRLSQRIRDRGLLLKLKEMWGLTVKWTEYFLKFQEQTTLLPVATVVGCSLGKKHNSTASIKSSFTHLWKRIGADFTLPVLHCVNDAKSFVVIKK